MYFSNETSDKVHDAADDDDDDDNDDDNQGDKDDDDDAKIVLPDGPPSI